MLVISETIETYKYKKFRKYLKQNNLNANTFTGFFVWSFTCVSDSFESVIEVIIILLVDTIIIIVVMISILPYYSNYANTTPQNKEGILPVATERAWLM